MECIVKNSILGRTDILIPNRKHIEDFLETFDGLDCVRVFDFGGAICHKQGFQGFSLVRDPTKDMNGTLPFMKRYMLCIEDAINYESLELLLEKRNVELPVETRKQMKGVIFEEFKEKQMNHWRQFTMEKAVEWEVFMGSFDLSTLQYRTGAKELLNKLLDKKYQVLIITSGVENVVRCALEDAGYDLDHPCLHVKGNNFIVNESGCAIGYDSELITPFTKMHIDYHKYGISDKKFAIQAGDSLGDAHMINDYFDRKNVVSIGFTNGEKQKDHNFPKTFDIICTEYESGFEPIQKLFM